MAGFTMVTVTGQYGVPGQSPEGTLTFTLTQPMTNADTTLIPIPIVAELSETGSFSIELPANDDPATVPQGVQYGVTEEILDAQPRDYFIAVSHATNSVDISTLAPGETGWL